MTCLPILILLGNLCFYRPTSACCFFSHCYYTTHRGCQAFLCSLLELRLSVLGLLFRPKTPNGLTSPSRRSIQSKMKLFAQSMVRPNIRPSMYSPSKRQTVQRTSPTDSPGFGGGPLGALPRPLHTGSPSHRASTFFPKLLDYPGPRFALTGIIAISVNGALRTFSDVGSFQTVLQTLIVRLAWPPLSSHWMGFVKNVCVVLAYAIAPLPTVRREELLDWKPNTGIACWNIAWKRVAKIMSGISVIMFEGIPSV